MDMGMMRQRLAPSVQDGRAADPAPSLRYWRRAWSERLGCRAHQDRIDDALFWKAIVAATGAGSVNTTWK